MLLFLSAVRGWPLFLGHSVCVGDKLYTFSNEGVTCLGNRNVNCVNLISRKTHKNTNTKIQQDTIILEETITKYISLTLRLQQQNIYYGTLPKASRTPTGHSSHSPTLFSFFWLLLFCFFLLFLLFALLLFFFFRRNRCTWILVKTII